MKKLYRVYIVFPNGNRFRNVRLFKKDEAEEIKRQAELELKDTPCWVEIESAEVEV